MCGDIICTHLFDTMLFMCLRVIVAEYLHPFVHGLKLRKRLQTSSWQKHTRRIDKSAKQEQTCQNAAPCIRQFYAASMHTACTKNTQERANKKKHTLEPGKFFVSEHVTKKRLKINNSGTGTCRHKNATCRQRRRFFLVMWGGCATNWHHPSAISVDTKNAQIHPARSFLGVYWAADVPSKVNICSFDAKKKTISKEKQRWSRTNF